MFAHARFQRIKPVLAQQWNRIVIGGNLPQGVVSCGGGQTAGSGSSKLRRLRRPTISYQPSDMNRAGIVGGKSS
jgi:hypothetical protein